ncbi:MAG: M81 family metallopeptidase, partial [Spirochaetales bacterium]|nr:M81 family metallopeptidase [Spirochaetales bacterium]
VDFFETGARAATILLDSLNGKIHARTYRTVIPMIVPASSYTTLRGSFGALADYAQKQVAKGRILDYTIFQMQPWLDVELGGTCVVTIGEDEDEAKACATDFAKKLFNMRDNFKQDLYQIDEVIRKAEKNRSGKPVVLVDSSDSPNAGACGDSPAVLERIKALGSNVRAAFYIKDTPAVKELWNRGIGSVNRIRLGATMSHEFYRPVEIEVEVLSMHNGVFTAEGPAGRGTLHDCGRVVTVRWNNVDIVICEAISYPGELQLYRHFGVEPTFYDLVTVKACTSFRVAYEPIASEICETDTPGTAPINLGLLHFKRLPDSFYPFSDISGYEIPEPSAMR